MSMLIKFDQFPKVFNIFDIVLLSLINKFI